MKRIVFGALVALLQLIPTAFAQPTTTTCTASGQPGCLEFAALNARYVPGKHEAFRTKAAWEEEVKRAPEFWKAYHQGLEHAAKGRSFDFTVYSVDSTPINAAELVAYRANGRNHTVTKTQVVDVTDKVTLPTTTQKFGVARVFRVTAEGDEAFVASLQMSDATLARVAHVTVCSSEKTGAVVPNRVTGNESYGISKGTLEWFVKKGHKRLPLLFLSND